MHWRANTWARRRNIRARSNSRGFSLVEALIVVAISLVLTVVAVPLVDSSMQVFRLNAAVSSATGAISATRYQAIMRGYPYAIAFDPTSFKYQVSNEPTGTTTFSNVGSAVPLSGTSGMTVSAATTLQFSPNGTVKATVGGMSFSISYAGKTKTITVSAVGSVSVQ